MPALSLLISGGAPVFGFAMGAFPIFSGATLLFTLAGWRGPRAASGASPRGDVAFLASFLFGGPITMWGVPSLALLGGAAVLDWRAARSSGVAVKPRHLRWAAYLLAALLAIVLVVLHARRFTG